MNVSNRHPHHPAQNHYGVLLHHQHHSQMEDVVMGPTTTTPGANLSSSSSNNNVITIQCGKDLIQYAIRYLLSSSSSSSPNPRKQGQRRVLYLASSTSINKYVATIQHDLSHMLQQQHVDTAFGSDIEESIMSRLEFCSVDNFSGVRMELGYVVVGMCCAEGVGSMAATGDEGGGGGSKPTTPTAAAPTTSTTMEIEDEGEAPASSPPPPTLIIMDDEGLPDAHDTSTVLKTVAVMENTVWNMTEQDDVVGGNEQSSSSSDNRITHRPQYIYLAHSLDRSGWDLVASHVHAA